MALVLGAGLSLLLADSALAQEWSWLSKAGALVDSNPRRVDTALDESGELDAGLRLFGSAAVIMRPRPRLTLGIDASLGAVLYRSATVADSFAAAFSSSLQAAVAREATLTWAVRLKERAERGSANDDDPAFTRRDYRIIGTQLGLRRRYNDVTLGVDAGWMLYEFKPRDDFSWTGPAAGVWVRWRATDALRFTLRQRVSHRVLRQDAFLRDDGVCPLVASASTGRRDTVLSPSFGADLSTKALVGDLTYSWAGAYSNDCVAGYRRHSVALSLTMLPVGDVLLRVSGQLSRTRATGDRRGAGGGTSDLIDPDNDEWNRIGVSLEHPIAGPLSVELHYTFYAQEFGNENAGFRRHVANLSFALRGTTDADAERE